MVSERMDKPDGIREVEKITTQLNSIFGKDYSILREAIARMNPDIRDKMIRQSRIAGEQLPSGPKELRWRGEDE